MGILFCFFLIIISSIIIWRSCVVFDVASKKIGKNLKNGVRGATINAIGSSLPELFTAFFFLLFMQNTIGFSAGLATIIGSAIFNILIIPSIVIFIVLKNNTSIIINKKPIIRDSVFLIISQLSLLLVLNIGEKEAQITLDESCFIMLIYLIYLIYLSKGSLIKKNKEQHITNKNAWKNLIFSLIPIAIGCAVLVFACELFAGSAFKNSYSWLSKIGNMGELEGLGMELPIIALFFAAAASSVPDLIISYRDAKSNDVEDSLANPIGSNLFDICVAFGFPLFLYNIFFQNKPISFEGNEGIYSIETISLLLIIMISLTIIFLFSLIFAKKYNIYHAVLFTSLYILFIIIIVLKVI